MMHGPYITAITAEYRSRHEGAVPPLRTLLREPWVAQFLRVTFSWPVQTQCRVAPASIIAAVTLMPWRHDNVERTSECAHRLRRSPRLCRAPSSPECNATIPGHADVRPAPRRCGMPKLSWRVSRVARRLADPHLPRVPWRVDISGGCNAANRTQSTKKTEKRSPQCPIIQVISATPMTTLRGSSHVHSSWRYGRSGTGFQRQRRHILLPEVPWYDGRVTPSATRCTTLWRRMVVCPRGKTGTPRDSTRFLAAAPCV